MKLTTEEQALIERRRRRRSREDGETLEYRILEVQS